MLAISDDGQEATTRKPRPPHRPWQPPNTGTRQKRPSLTCQGQPDQRPRLAPHDAQRVAKASAMSGQGLRPTMPNKWPRPAPLAAKACAPPCPRSGQGQPTSGQGQPHERPRHAPNHARGVAKASLMSGQGLRPTMPEKWPRPAP